MFLSRAFLCQRDLIDMESTFVFLSRQVSKPDRKFQAIPNVSELLRKWPCQNCLHWSIEIQSSSFFTLKSEISFKRRTEIGLVVILRKKRRVLGKY